MDVVPQVKTGMLRSEHQKMAVRTIRETVDTELHRRSKERDKERLQAQQLVVQELVLEGEGTAGGPAVSYHL